MENSKDLLFPQGSLILVTGANGSVGKLPIQILKLTKPHNTC